ncbi:hypothetical protein CCACVL1_09889 [Corchorus capsularis]|uniref:Glucose-methanol-choline oxidoreductase N-terminal domain-containing protein n=1 Tax=Corchorus capsularis TaxID=210143 RepID=A0A1R3ITR0_COCAP|nr:hypothetical protein CCACVL1_09889 [Corchorus capsularis]
MDLGSWKFFSIFLVVFALYHFCHAETAGLDYNFVEESIFAPEISYFDYIIVGGGTAGCPLAATLSETVNVLVLERGGSPYDDPNKSDKANILVNLLDILPNSYTEMFITEDGVINHRARVLGGGSVINGGFYSHAEPEFLNKSGFDDLALVNDSYRWVEKKLVFKPEMLQWQTAFKDGLLEAKVLPFNGYTFDHINGTKISGTIFDEDGHRHSAADLLEYAKPDNIKHKALLTLGSKGEVILAAGTIGSPQLLMLSGIGPAHQLGSLGIKMIMDQPMVGQEITDNPSNCLLVFSPAPVEVSSVSAVGITKTNNFIESISGVNLLPSWSQWISDNLLPIINQTGAKVNDAPNRTTLRVPGGLILSKVRFPMSKGHLELRSTNPKDTPKVRFNYFKDPKDIKTCVQGMETLMKTVDSKAFSKFRYEAITAKENLKIMTYLPVNLRPKHNNTATSLEQYCIDTVVTEWHYHGGCEFGKVVDKNYRVRGVDSLRVLDASTFKSAPGTNPQATLMMLGSFVQEATSAPRVSYYDYIIIGGGTAGCPLAATLSTSAKVLVLERGGSPYTNPGKSDEENFFPNLLDRSPNSYSQQFTSEDGVYNNRARVLGGGSVINAGFYSHAESDFLKQAGLNAGLVNVSYQWVEKKVAFEPPMLQWQSALKNGLIQAGVLPDNGFTFDHLYGTKVGGIIFDKNGHRHTAADLLEYANPLRIKGMADNPLNVLFIPSPSPVEVSLVQMVGVTRSDSYIEACSGVSFTPSWTRRVAKELASILNQESTMGLFQEAIARPQTSLNTKIRGGIIFEKLKNPISTGHLELRNTNPHDNPKVTFNYFRSPEDLRTCVRGMETVLNAINSEAFSDFRYKLLSTTGLLDLVSRLPLNRRPRHLNTAFSLEQFCLDTVMTIWHYHGGCLVGKVVDKDLKVIGVDALRVIDGSTFTRSPGTNPQATVMMLGRYMGLTIQQERYFQETN